MNKSKIKKVGQDVIKLESMALSKLSRSLGKDFVQAVELIANQNGKIIISGVNSQLAFISALSLSISASVSAVSS